MRELSNREKIEELIDGIFLLNHNIVSRMIRRYENPEKSQSDRLDDMVEDADYKKLGEYYSNLRKLIREGIVIQEKMVILDYEDYMEEDELLQMQDNEGQTCKIDLTKEMEDRLDELFVSFFFKKFFHFFFRECSFFAHFSHRFFQIRFDSA